MPNKNTLLNPKSELNVFGELRSLLNLAKFSHNNFWQVAIFLSIAIVLQALSSNKSVNASNLNRSSQQSTGKVNNSNQNRRLKSTFLPRIFNLIADSSISSSTVPTSKLPTPQTGAVKTTPLQPVASSGDTAVQVDNKALNKSAVPRIHQVKRGETITAIANKYQVSSNELIKLNQLANSNIIFVDQRLAIPNASENVDLNIPQRPNLVSVETSARSSATSIDLPTTVLPSNAPTELNQRLQPEPEDPYIAQLRTEIAQRRAQYKQQQARLNPENPSLISTAEPTLENADLANSNLSPQLPTSTSQPQISREVIRRNLQSNAEDTLALALPSLLDDEYLPSAFDGYIWPAQGVITSGYGWRWGRMHRGIDIGAPLGTPIVAAAAGEVIGVGWYSGYGNMVKLEHLDGSITYYAHNQRNLVTHGQKVKQGEQIAEMGSTGRSTGPHLHFEIRPDGRQAIDPLALLGSR